MARSYENMVDYVRTQLDGFDQRDVCRVDSLVFSWLSYYRLPEEVQEIMAGGGIPLKDLYRADWFDAMCGNLYDPQASIDLLSALAASPRFREVLVCGYVSKSNERAEQQFSAMTFVLSERETFVAYRGTDNTLVGWKEDFNMSFQTAVPSQVAAVRYLNRVAACTQGRIWCGGHSKGGNLAVYAGTMCDDATRARIVRCFSHDGPGFSSKTMADPRWSTASQIADKTIPQSSVIGMVFERQEQDFTVVHSHGTGLSQHDPFSWEVDWRDFVCDDKLGLAANYFDASINEWLATASDEDRERFIDLVFSVISASGEESFGQIKRNWRTAVPHMIAAAMRLDASDRELVLTALGDILRAMLPNVSLGL